MPEGSTRIVWSRESAEVCAVRGAGAAQGADAREDAQDVGARRLLFQVQRGGLQDELDLLLEGDGLQRRFVDGRVGGADERVAMPRDREHHAAVAGVRDHDGALGRQETTHRRRDARPGWARWQARRAGSAMRRTVSLNGPGGVDHDARGGFELFACFDDRGSARRPLRRR